MTWLLTCIAFQTYNTEQKEKTKENRGTLISFFLSNSRRKDPDLTEIKLIRKYDQDSRLDRNLNRSFSEFMRSSTSTWTRFDRSAQDNSILVDLTMDAAINVHIVPNLFWHAELTQPKRYSVAHTQLIASLTHPNHCSLATIPIY
jgi:hypothetical protein